MSVRAQEAVLLRRDMKNFDEAAETYNTTMGPSVERRPVPVGDIPQCPDIPLDRNLIHGVTDDGRPVVSAMGLSGSVLEGVAGVAQQKDAHVGRDHSGNMVVAARHAAYTDLAVMTGEALLGEFLAIITDYKIANRLRTAVNLYYNLIWYWRTNDTTAIMAGLGDFLTGLFTEVVCIDRESVLKIIQHL